MVLFQPIQICDMHCNTTCCMILADRMISKHVIRVKKLLCKKKKIISRTLIMAHIQYTFYIIMFRYSYLLITAAIKRLDFDYTNWLTFDV